MIKPPVSGDIRLHHSALPTHHRSAESHGRALSRIEDYENVAAAIEIHGAFRERKRRPVVQTSLAVPRGGGVDRVVEAHAGRGRGRRLLPRKSKIVSSFAGRAIADEDHRSISV